MTTVATQQIEMGHLATLHHQRAIKRLLLGLDKPLLESKSNLEALPETDIDPGNPESKCPDIILRDNLLETVPVVIEIATNLGAKTDFRKLSRLIEDTEFGIEEGFVFNFERRTWHKFSRSLGPVLENPSWSEVLKMDLAELV